MNNQYRISLKAEGSDLMKGKVLIILTGSTSAPLAGGTENKTGVDIRTLMEPMEIILNAGYKVSFATPDGGTPIFDPVILHSLDAELVKEYKDILDNLGHFDLPLNIDEISEEALSLYDGLLIPGGFGAYADLNKNPGMRPIIKHFHLHKKPIGAIAQGVMGLTYPLNDGETWIFDGFVMTGSTKSMEKAYTKKFKKEKFEFSLQAILEKKGGTFKSGTALKKAYLQDYEMLLTAQDEHACEKFGEELREKLNDYVENR